LDQYYATLVFLLGVLLHVKLLLFLYYFLLQYIHFTSVYHYFFLLVLSNQYLCLSCFVFFYFRLRLKPCLAYSMLVDCMVPTSTRLRYSNYHHSSKMLFSNNHPPPNVLPPPAISCYDTYSVCIFLPQFVPPVHALPVLKIKFSLILPILLFLLHFSPSLSPCLIPPPPKKNGTSGYPPLLFRQ
jgi:hypothetical protein